jgi:hypothetical protein
MERAENTEPSINTRDIEVYCARKVAQLQLDIGRTLAVTMPTVNHAMCAACIRIFKRRLWHGAYSRADVPWQTQ